MLSLIFTSSIRVIVVFKNQSNLQTKPSIPYEDFPIEVADCQEKIGAFHGFPLVSVGGITCRELFFHCDGFSVHNLRDQYFENIFFFFDLFTFRLVD